MSHKIVHLLKHMNNLHTNVQHETCPLTSSALHFEDHACSLPMLVPKNVSDLLRESDDIPNSSRNPLGDDPESVCPQIESRDYSNQSDYGDEISLDHSFKSESIPVRDNYRQNWDIHVPSRDPSPPLQECCDELMASPYINRRKFALSEPSDTSLCMALPILIPSTCTAPAKLPDLNIQLQDCRCKMEDPGLTEIKPKTASTPAPSTKKQKGVKRTIPEPPTIEQFLEGEGDEDTRRARQERNRMCARECRRRKKVYMENMESQVKLKQFYCDRLDD